MRRAKSAETLMEAHNFATRLWRHCIALFFLFHCSEVAVFESFVTLFVGPDAREDSSGAGRLQAGQARQARKASGRTGRL